MNILKSHFWYHKSQRNGIFIIVLLILILQSIIFYVDFSSEDVDFLDSIEVSKIRKQIDSLKVIEKARRTPKIVPFNPNYITDYKGYQLGMSLTEIDRLLLFREKNKFINSKREFQKITKVSDSLLAIIAPYFKFPDWVSKVNQQKQRKNKNSSKSNLVSKNKTISTKDINKATKEDLRTVIGIGEKLSERIIKYRSKLQGFSFESQLHEVWGLKKEIITRLFSIFSIIEKPIIKKRNINALTFKELLKNPYIDYDLCKKIFEYKDEIAEFQDISELKNIKDFPMAKYDRIVLYLKSN
jgi:DNA uptake protein ComE-like DNA-binding protein